MHNIQHLIQNMKYPDDFLNKIIQGDCLEIMKQMPDKCVDLVLTDPFYLPPNQFDWKMMDDFYWDFNKKWLSEVKRICKDKFHLFISFGAPQMYDMERLLRELELEVRSRVVWNYRNSTKSVAKNRQFAKTYEFIFHCSSGKSLNFPEKWDDRRFDVRIIAMPQSNFKKEEKVHPYQKPMELWKDFVEFGSSVGEVVFDPFSGSGTTAVAAKGLGRNFIGVELSPKYCEIAQKRLDAQEEPLF